MSSSLADDLTVPGTTVLLDEKAETGNDNFKLVPTPSSSLDDPLNWSLKRKWLSLFCMILWVLAATFGNGCLYPLYEPLMEVSGLTLAEINTGVGYLYFFQQIFALVIAPLMVAVGKRPVFIATCLGLCIFPFALSQVSTYSQWIGLIIVNTLFTSLVYVGPETVLSDVFFYHERSLPFGVFVASIWGGPLFAPVVSGYIYSRFGMNGPPYFAGGFAVLVAIFLFFFFEETNFERPTEASPPVQVLTEDGLAPSDSPYEFDNKKGGTTEVVQVSESAHVHNRVVSPWPGPRPFQRVRVSPFAWGIIWRGAFQSLALLRLPIILWVGLLMSFTQIYYNTMAALSSGVLSAAPYNFKPNFVGLTFLSPLIAVVPGAIVAGWLTDRWTVRQARRNGGIAEAEHKLPLAIVPAILAPIGCLMIGLGSYFGVHWICFVMGEFVLTIAGPLANLLAISYAFDSFHSIHPAERDGPRAMTQHCAPYILAPTLLAMAITFGFNYAVTPWAFDWGFRNWAISAACIGAAIPLSAFIMYKFGKRFRKSGASYYCKIINI